MIMCIFLFLLWIIFNGRITIEICLFGAVIAAAVYAFCVYALGYHPAHEKKILSRLGLYAVYAVTLVGEIVKANLAVMKVILTKAEYHPAIVRIKVPLEENFSRVLLSNSITLTPGTVTVEQSGEEYLVLCLDKESAYDIPGWNLVRLLKKMEEK